MDIYTDRTFKPKEIKEFLSELFPELIFFYWDYFSSDEPNGFNMENQYHKNYYIENNKQLIEFQNCITFYRMPKENGMERDLYIGKRLSDKYNIRVLVIYNIPGREFETGWNIIFDKGKSYLAEDFDTNFGDSENKNTLKMDNEYRLEIKKFDKLGTIKSQ